MSNTKLTQEVIYIYNDKRRKGHEFGVMQETREIRDGRGRYGNSVNAVYMYETSKKMIRK